MCQPVLLADRGEGFGPHLEAITGAEVRQGGRVGLAGTAVGGPLDGKLDARFTDLAPLGPLLDLEPLGIDSGRVVLDPWDP